MDPPPPSRPLLSSATPPPVSDHRHAALSGGGEDGPFGTAPSHRAHGGIVKHKLHIQLESLSPGAAAALWWMWIGALVTAVILQAFPNWQWSCNNLCGSQFRCSIANSDSWLSPCGRVVYDNATNTTVGELPGNMGGSYRSESESLLALPGAEPSSSGSEPSFLQRSAASIASRFRDTLEESPPAADRGDVMIRTTASPQLLAGGQTNASNNAELLRIAECPVAGDGNASTENPNAAAEVFRERLCYQWSGPFGLVGASRFNRFVHVVISVANPTAANKTWHENHRNASDNSLAMPPWRRGQFQADGSASSYSQPAHLFDGGRDDPSADSFDTVQLLNVTVGFFDANGTLLAAIRSKEQTFCVLDRCTQLTLFIPLQEVNTSSITVIAGTLFPVWWYAFETAGISTVYQNAPYTLASVGVRYLLLVPFALSIIRFVWMLWSAAVLFAVEKGGQAAGGALRILTSVGHSSPTQQQEALPPPTIRIVTSSGHEAPPDASESPALDAAVTNALREAEYPSEVASPAGPLPATSPSLVLTPSVTSKPKQTRRWWTLANYEQHWVVILQVSMLLYLDPLFLWGVLSPSTSFLAFVEVRIPYYFLGVVVAFVLSMTSSATWRLSHTGSALFRRRLVASIILLVFNISLITIDIVEASTKKYSWSEEHCPNLRCSSLGYAFYGLIVAGALTILVWLVYLRIKLPSVGSYIETRREQLCLRLFVFIFIAYVLYFLLSTLVRYLAYGDVSQGVVGFHPLLSIGTVVTAAVFVMLMAQSYATVVRSGRMPPDPREIVADDPDVDGADRIVDAAEGSASDDDQSPAQSPRADPPVATTTAAAEGKTSAATHFDVLPQCRFVSVWKLLRWPTAWYTWLSLHGGYAYYFASHREEQQFEDIQNGDMDDWKMRQELKQRYPRRFAGGERVRSDQNLSMDHAVSPLLSRSSSKQFDDTAAEDDQASSGGGGDADQRSGRRSVARFVMDTGAEFLEQVETRLVDGALNLTSKVFSKTRQHFFNLEDAIDAFNLAYEAYGVPVSLGDGPDAIETGLETIMPPIFGGGAAGKSFECTWAAAAATSAPSATAATTANGGAAVHRSYQSTTSAGGGAVARPPGGRSTSTASAGSAESMATLNSSSAHTSSDRLAVPPPGVPPINVDQYGYRVIDVGEEGVQYVISVRSGQAPHHRTPRRGCLAISFRGTDNMSDWRSNCSAWRVPWDETLTTTERRVQSVTVGLVVPTVHSGFLTVWRRMRTRVMAQVERHFAGGLDTAGNELLITGHSLGGAIAVLCAYDIACTMSSRFGKLIRTPAVYTFGAPRVGNGAFANAYDRRVPRTFRVVNEKDPVSHLSIMGGSHCGFEIDIDSAGNLVCDPLVIEHLLRPGGGWFTGVTEHLMGAYAANLNRIADQDLNSRECKCRCLQVYDGCRPAPTATAATAAQQASPGSADTPVPAPEGDAAVSHAALLSSAAKPCAAVPVTPAVLLGASGAPAADTGDR